MARDTLDSSLHEAATLIKQTDCSIFNLLFFLGLSIPFVIEFKEGLASKQKHGNMYKRCIYLQEMLVRNKPLVR